jgi:ribosomal protein S18 acetylase RimI-like enzyme
MIVLMGINIRLAVVEDARAIARVRVVTWQYAYQGIISQQVLDALDIEQQSARWHEALMNPLPESRAFVAEMGVPGDAGEESWRSVVGFCICGPERSQDDEYRGEIYALYVLPECHRKGVGKKLVEKAAQFLREQGYERMVIYVLRDNWPSRAFYEAIGGKAVREKQVEIGGAMLVEIGYGYAVDYLLKNS